MHPPRFLAPLLLMLVGCSGDATDTADGGTTETGTPSETGTPGTGSSFCGDGPGLTVGTGENEYIALAAGDPVVIVHGPQGGWHIETAGLVTGTAQEVGMVPKVTRTSDGVQIAGADQNEEYKALFDYDSTKCEGKFAGLRAFVDDYIPSGMTYQEFICTLEGEEIEIEVTVSDLNTLETVTSSSTATVQLDPIDVSECP